MDVNHDGVLDINETDEVMKMFDTDRDYNLKLSEFKKYYNSSANTQVGKALVTGSVGEKEMMNVMICGHADSGISTATGRLIWELGGGAYNLQGGKDNIQGGEFGKPSFNYAFLPDKLTTERERSILTDYETKRFATNNYIYTVIDAPGHRGFINNMISGTGADVGILMVPGNFTTAIQKGDIKAGEIQGQTQQHARLLNLLGVKNIIVAINTMNSDPAKYEEVIYNEIRAEMKNMLTRVGWTSKFVENNIAFIPISGGKGDNLITKSTNMSWWKGVDIEKNDDTKPSVHIDTLFDALDIVPPRDDNSNSPIRMPISDLYKTKGVGDVIVGRVEQGTVKSGYKVKFVPTHTKENPCEGTIQTIEEHHTQIDTAKSGDSIGITIKGLKNMPRIGDVMIDGYDTTLNQVNSFTAQVQVLDVPGELKVGYSPIGFVRTGHSVCKISKFAWKVGKEKGWDKIENPTSIKANEIAEIVFEPQTPFVTDTFETSPGLSRVAFFDGNTAVMMGKVISVNLGRRGDTKK